MNIKWNVVDIRGNAHGLYLEGSFDHPAYNGGEGSLVYFTMPLYDTDIDMRIYKMTEDVQTVENVEPEMRTSYWHIINKCRADIRDVISSTLAKYED